MGDRLIGYSSVIVGFLTDLTLILIWLFVDFFTGVGIRAKIGLFISFTILIVSGVFLLYKKQVSILLYKIFGFILIIDRITVLLLYCSYISYLEIIIPFIVGVPFFIFSFRIVLPR
jgi:hypothetical protein